mmetsp:Transcript_6434/g.15205  ORF Transcript_6434/g.15205 Transcript_6434/m.15205 type:complete len:231 (-) Transcript_6434:551-1243(-)
MYRSSSSNHSSSSFSHGRSILTAPCHILWNSTVALVSCISHVWRTISSSCCSSSKGITTVPWWWSLFWSPATTHAFLVSMPLHVGIPTIASIVILFSVGTAIWISSSPSSTISITWISTTPVSILIFPSLARLWWHGRMPWWMSVSRANAGSRWWTSIFFWRPASCSRISVGGSMWWIVRRRSRWHVMRRRCMVASRLPWWWSSSIISGRSLRWCFILPRTGWRLSSSVG